MNPNNPYHRGAGLYDFNLALPFIATIRRQEAQAVGELINRYRDRSHRALEVGPGTGFYTLRLAEAFGEVVAVEDSAGMAHILRDRVSRAGAQNVSVIANNFLEAPLEGEFDIAVAIGVLDYTADPDSLVARMCALTRRAVILTVPQRGLWGTCFAVGGRLRKTQIYRHDQSAVARWAHGWRCLVREVGLTTPLTRGLTLVAALEAP